MTVVARAQTPKIKWNADLLNRKKGSQRKRASIVNYGEEELMVYKQN